MSHSSNWFVRYALKNGEKPLPKLDPAIPREDLTPSATRRSTRCRRS